MNPFILSGAAIFLTVTTTYIVSRMLKDNSIIDIVWGLGFCIVAMLCYFTFPPIITVKTILLVMILLWGSRLAAYILYRKIGKGEDFRYAKWRRDWGKTEIWRSYLQIYLLQGLLMFLISIPIIQLMSNKSGQTNLNWGHYIGVFIFLIGWLVETIADWQKNRFKQKNPKGIMSEGLWSISRHPNYFGEVCLWWGLGIYCMSSGYWLTSLFGILIVTYLLRFLSGVPMLERSKEGNEAYAAYKKSTPLFIPFIDKKD